MLHSLCLYLCPCVSSPGAIFLLASIAYALGDLKSVFLLNFCVDTNSPPAPVFPGVSCKSCCCDYQDAAAAIERPLLYTAASCSDALCVFTVRYSMGPSSFPFHLFLLFDHHLISEPFARFFFLFFFLLHFSFSNL